VTSLRAAIALLVVAGAVLAACRDKALDAPAATDALTIDDCGEIVAHAVGRLRAATRAANPPGAVSCSADADCVEAEPASCVKLCSGNGVPRSAAAPFAASMRAIEAEDCVPWRAAGCATIAPLPRFPCGAATVRCLDGRCQMHEP
jgi:hypothetical protein